MIARLVVVRAAMAGSVAALGRAPAVPFTQSDLDALMKDVVARRDENWKKLQQYILDERDEVQVRGGSAVPVWGEVLSEEASDSLHRRAMVRGTLTLITDYVASIQAK